MCQNIIQLNKEKTEVIAFGNKDEVLKVNAYLDSRGQTTKNQVKNLGVILQTGAKSILLKRYRCLNGAWTDTYKNKKLPINNWIGH